MTSGDRIVILSLFIITNLHLIAVMLAVLNEIKRLKP
jgi:hypothetical protein